MIKSALAENRVVEGVPTEDKTIQKAQVIDHPLKLEPDKSVLIANQPYLERGFRTMCEFVDGYGDEWSGGLTIFGRVPEDFERDFFFSDMSGLTKYEEIARKRVEKLDMQQGKGEYLRSSNGNWAKAFQEIERRKGKGLLWLDSDLGDFYRRMFMPTKGKDPDGAAVFSTDGYILGAQVIVHRPDGDLIPEETEYELAKLKNLGGDTGTRSIAGTYISLMGLPAILGSKDAKTVVGLYDGRVPWNMTYDSRFRSNNYIMENDL